MKLESEIHLELLELKLTWKKLTNWKKIIYTTDKVLEIKKNKNNFIKKALIITLHYYPPLQENDPSKIKVSEKINKISEKTDSSPSEVKWLRERSLKRKKNISSKIKILEKVKPFSSKTKWLRERSLKRKEKAPSKVNILKKINPFKKSNTFSSEKLNTFHFKIKKNDKKKKDDKVLCAA